MVIFNKLVMEMFPYPNFLLIIQNSTTILLNCLGTSAGIFSMSAWKADHFKIWAMPTATFSIMLVTSLKALPLVAVATTVVFRNIGTVAVACGDSLFFGKEFNRDMKTALGVILGGSLVYSYYDLNFDFHGYMWMSANTVIFACNVLYEKYAVVSVDQTAVGVSCYQNLLSLPMLTVVLLSTGETAAFTDMQKLSTYYKCIIVMTGFFGCLLSICYMSLNKFASPTAITIGSNLNKLVSAVIGGIVFKNAVTTHAILGLLICMAGG
jgi:drug/metabolite transporter (DMT)-like permease